MELVKLGLSFLGAIASLVCFVIILVDMFRDEVWKGILGLLCGLYALYYALFDFDHENKWLIVLVWLIGGSGSYFLRR